MGFFFLLLLRKWFVKVEQKQLECLQWGNWSYLHFNKKGRKNKPLVWSGHTAFSSSQLQPCCRVLVMAILEYKLFTCSNTQTTAGIQVFFPPSIFSFFFLHCTSVCLDVCTSLVLCSYVRPGESIWMKDRTGVAGFVNLNTCNWHRYFVQQRLCSDSSFASRFLRRDEQHVVNREIKSAASHMRDGLVQPQKQFVSLSSSK